MTVVSKIDSNITGLRFAIEQADGTLPVTPTWYPLEPNQYDKFGGAIKTIARNPINDSRQRKKGVVVDLEASAGFEMDITEDNTQLLFPSFFFAQPRTKVELAVGTVTAAGNTYAPAAGGASYFAGNLLFAKNFQSSLNNGLDKVTGTPTANSITVLNTTADETSVGGIISRVGHEFSSGALTVDVSGALPKITVSGVVQALGTLTAVSNPTNGTTVTINGKVYTFQTVLTNSDGNVFIAGTLAATLINLRNAINLNGLGIPGTDYALATTVNPVVTATATGTTLVVTAIIGGTTGNAITTTTTTAWTWGGATLASGAGRSMLEFGLIPGEYVCVGDDGAGFFFANSVNNGLKRVKSISNSSITFDKSTNAMVTDSGTGKTVRIFFGRVLKNEVGTLVQRQTVQFERTLGAPDSANPTQIQAEYITKCIADTMELNVKTADKLTAKMTFQGSDQETRNGVTGVKAGNRPVLASQDAFNSSSNVVRLHLAVLDATANPAELFAYLLDANLSIKNNVKANKAIKYLGSFDHSAGTFEVDCKMTAYFATVDAIAAVRGNSDVTLDLTFAKANQGITIDLPLITLATDGASVKQDEAVELSLTSMAATGAKLDTNFNHTLLMVYWDYLPTLAA
jgi:hypothetical protein